MISSQLPVIFLAFANDKQRRQHYLESVTKEKNAIEEALAPAKGKLFEVVIETDISIGKIWEVFQSNTYRDRICIFHFGGHADGFQLLLESWSGQHEIAFGDGLVSFLSRQKSLKLIFLNGCSTRELVLELTKKGIPSAIGTTHSIYDSIAAELAPNFYRALGEGIPLQRAWQEAIDQSNTKEPNKDKSRAGRIYPTENSNEWFLQFHEGAQQAKLWNLPDEANNPLFGLELPKNYTWPLPAEPYKGLQRFIKSDASIFFGRGAEIRQLFDSIKGVHPVILFYGQSGVGKSSLLEAGLLPRIEESYHTVYARRNEDLGLSKILDQALQVDSELENEDELELGNNDEKDILEFKQKLESLAAQEQTPGVQSLMDKFLQELSEKEKSKELNPLLKKWHDLENTNDHNKPLIVILDQVEEIFTRPLKGKGQNEELRELCQEIKDLFVSTNILKGKLILSFRKEYQAEIEKELNNFMIPFTKVFLGPLSKQGIMEAVMGINTNEYTKSHYQLNIEYDLPLFIANKILGDYGQSDIDSGPIAPIVQLLLKKMWDKASREKEKIFTKELYDQIGGMEGLGEFLERLIHSFQVSPRYNSVVESGFLHDLLFKFITYKNTAEQQSLEELEESYRKNKYDLSNILEDLQNYQVLFPFYLDDLLWLRLMHDALAPIVRRLHEQSNYPIQRLSRILLNHLRHQSLLTFEELVYFDEWQHWFRSLSESEKKILKDSQKKNIKPLVKYYLKKYGFEKALYFLIDLLEKEENTEQHLQLLLIKSKFQDLEERLKKGIIAEDGYLNAIQLIQQGLIEFLERFGVMTSDQVLLRIFELKLTELLTERKFEQLFENIDILLKELIEEKLVDDFSSIIVN